MMLTDLTIAAARDGLRAKSFSARELTQAHIDAVEALNPRLNAFITTTPDLAAQHADAADIALAAGQGGPLAGIPLAMKDLFCTQGVRTTAGSRILENFIPPYESTVSANLLRDGAVFLGKTNLDEFAMGSSNMTSAFGPVENPWKRRDSDAALVPGGSSGGSAAAVSARIAMGATGTDTGGSIRQPAAFCGLAGIKPTYGRCSRWGVVAFASSLDQPGPFARSVQDCAILLGSMAGFDPKDSTSVEIAVPDYEAACRRGVRGKRIGVPREYHADGMSSEIETLWQQGLAWLRDAGAEIVDVSLPHTKYGLATYYIVAPAEASSNLARYDGVRFGLREESHDLTDLYERTRAAGFGAEVKRRILIGTYVLSAGYYDAYYLRAQKVRSLILKDFTDVFTKVDALLTPTAPSAAFGQGEKMNDPIAMYLNDVFTVPASMAGVPAMSVPAGLSAQGLPLGLQVIGKPFDEETVFAVSQVIEDAAAFSRKAGRDCGRPRMSYTIEGSTGTWEIVCGLEVHAQVISKSKLFSGAATDFGAEPNTQVSFVDAAFPGMLPVLNKECVAQAVRTGLGLNAQINLTSRFDRKNYFYADLPSGYQISQFEFPIVGKGEIEIELADGSIRNIGVTRLHLEQDAGKSLHDQDPSRSFIDLNRCGVALMEIVSEPDIRTPEEAGAYLRKLRTVLRYLGTCDGNMDEGSMRADVNVSVRHAGEEFRTRCEVKNVNSVRFVMLAIEAEAKRQVEVWESGGEVRQETRLFDPARNETRSMRSKEDAHDYRYFPDPDLLPLVLTQDYVDALAAKLPELPDAKRARFVCDYGIPLYDSGVLVADQITADFYESVAKGRDPRLAANWVIGDFFAALNRTGKTIETSPVSAANLGGLLDLMADNTINGRIAKDVFEEMVETGDTAANIVEHKGLKQVTDTGAIDAAVDQVLKANPDKLAEYKAGKEKLFGFFVGQTMKAMAGKGNPALVNEAIKARLGGP